MACQSTKLEKPDVCVVGAGPAGMSVALTLGAAGRRVVLLESGKFYSSGHDQKLNDGDHEGEPYAGLCRTRHRQVGGTANIWNVPVRGKPGAKYVPLSPRDVVGWPIGWTELEPYYIEAQELCGLGPFEYGADYWATPSRRPFHLEGTGLTSGVYQFGLAEQFTTVLINRLRRNEAVTLVSSASVVELALDHGRRRVYKVRAVGARGKTIAVEARVVILACGAVENTRLLLLAGLGNSGGSTWLGRGFMEHARDFSLELVPESPEIFASSSFYDLHVSQSGYLIGGRLALTDDAIESYQLPSASMTLVPSVRSRGPRKLVNRLSRSLRRFIGVPSPDRYGWSRIQSQAQVFDVFGIVLNLEQRSHPFNRIELCGRRDRFGNRLPRLVLHWTDQEQAELEHLRQLVGEWFQAAKLGQLRTRIGHRPNLSAHHHAGTTRMATHPRDGVVNPDGRVFGLENLYLAGASVFPSAGSANPTLTVVALALRLAQHIHSSLD
ncbi:MAG: GMC family oxidoreductase [Pseudomonadota bacterium]